MQRKLQMAGFPASSVSRKGRNGPCFLYLRFEILHPIGPKWMGDLFRPHKLTICPSKFWWRWIILLSCPEIGSKAQIIDKFLQLVNMLQVSSKSLALSSNSPGLRYAWLKEMMTSDDYRAARQRSIDLLNGNALNAWLNSMGSQDFEKKTSNK